MITIIKLLIDRRRAKKARNERVFTSIENIETVPSLTVLPLVDFFSGSTEAKTEPGVSYLVKAGDFSALLDVGYNMKGEHPSPLLHNMNLFGININDINALFISHHHLNHLGGGAREQRNHTFSLSHGLVDFPPIPVYSTLPLKPSSYNFNPESEIRVSLGPVKLAPGVYEIGSIPRALYIMGYTLYDISVRRIALLLQASFRPALAGMPLPFANSCRQIILDGDLPIRDSHSINSHQCRVYTSITA